MKRILSCLLFLPFLSFAETQPLVQIDVRMVSFPSAQLDALERAAGRPLPDRELLSLWQEGQGETLYAQSVKSIPGSSTRIDHVNERMYPTKMETPPNKKNAADAKEISYGGFETRPIGFGLVVTPTINRAERTINMLPSLELTQDLGIDKDVPESLRPLLPRFRSLAIRVNLTLQNGLTVVAGTSSSLDGKERHVLFLTASLVDGAGNLIEWETLAPQR